MEFSLYATDTKVVCKSVISLLYGGCKRDTARICCCCGAVVAGRSVPGARRCRPRDLLPGPRGAQQQTRRTPLLRSIDGTDGQTDGRTTDRYTDAAPLDHCQKYTRFRRFVRTSAPALNSL